MPGTICFQLKVIQSPTKRAESIHWVLTGQRFIGYVLRMEHSSRHGGHTVKKMFCFVSVGAPDNKHRAEKRNGEACRRGALLYVRREDQEGSEAEGRAAVWGAEGSVPGRGSRNGRGPEGGAVRNS